PARRSIDFARQAGAGEVVDHGEDAKAPAVVEDIEHEIEGPSLVHARRRREPRDPAWYAPSTPSTPDGEAFLRIEPIDPFEIDVKPFAAQQDVQASIAEATPFPGQGAQPLA